MALTLSTKTGTDAPEAGQYELVFVKHSDIVQMTDYEDKDKLINKIYCTFRIENFDYDPEVDDQNYNGHEFDVLYTASLNKRANLTIAMAALAGLTKEEFAALGDVQLSDYFGRRINATVEQTPGGYAKISAATPVRRKKANKPANVFLEDDEDGDE